MSGAYIDLSNCGWLIGARAIGIQVLPRGKCLFGCQVTGGMHGTYVTGFVLRVCKLISCPGAALGWFFSISQTAAHRPRSLSKASLLLSHPLFFAALVGSFHATEKQAKTTLERSLLDLMGPH